MTTKVATKARVASSQTKVMADETSAIFKD